MSSTLLRPSTARSVFRALSHAKPASTTFTRGKATLPDLPCNPSPCPPALGRQRKANTPNPRRLLRPRTLHLRPHHGAPPQKPPQHLRQLLQQLLLPARRAPILLLILQPRLHRPANRPTANDQFPRRRAHQPQLVLGEPGAQG